MRELLHGSDSSEDSQNITKIQLGDTPVYYAEVSVLLTNNPIILKVNLILFY